VLLVAAGVAAVGLTTTAMFVVPVIAAGCLAPLLRTAPRPAVVALPAAMAYPLAAGVFTLLVGGRNPQVYTAADVVPRALVHDVFGRGPVAFVAVAAVLAGPLLIRSAAGARMTASVVLSVGLLFIPGATLVLFRLTGLGEVLWRVSWAVPVAALVGVLGSEALPRARVPAARLLPAVAVGGALIAWGTPLWSGASGSGVSDSPRLKLSAHQLASARTVLARARPGDVILAPRPLSGTILKLSGSVVVVDPTNRYVRALAGVQGAHARERVLLEHFAGHGLASLAPPDRRVVAERRVAVALRALHVDLACVRARERRAQVLLLGERFTPVGASGRIACMRRRTASPLP
jgi:hypothetical protein